MRVFYYTSQYTIMKNNIIENWKAVPGYETYEVSDLGKVRSLKFGKIKLLKPRPSGHGYLSVTLCNNGELKRYLVQRLVYFTFNGPIPPGMVIDHVNDIKTDNRLENLQLLSGADNTRKARKGKAPWNKGKKHSEETKAKMRAAHRARRELTI